MAMCSTGSLGIIAQPQGAGSSIACCVCGTAASPPYSLESLSTAVGFSTPHAMSEFYGYAPPSATPIVWTSMGSSGTACDCRCCACTTGVVIKSECVGVQVSWVIFKTAGSTCGSIALYCGATCIGGCTVGTTSACKCSGTFTTYVQCFDNCHYVCMRSVIANPVTEETTVGAEITALTQCVGCYCIGSPSCVSVTVT